MKKIISILLVVILFLGCDNSKKSNINYSIQDFKYDPQIGVIFNIISNTKSNNTISYGTDYSFEEKINNEWHKIDLPLAFTKPIFINELPTEITINFTPDSQAYKKVAQLDDTKTYRLVKSLDIDSKLHNFVAEFTIKNNDIIFNNITDLIQVDK